MIGYKPHYFVSVEDGAMDVEDLFQTVIETEDIDVCQSGLDLINAAMHTNVIINKLMNDEYDEQ